MAENLPEMLRISKQAGIKKSIKFILIFAVMIGGLFGIAYSIEAYPKIFQVSVSLEKNLDIAPDEAVAINFSEPVFRDSLNNENIAIFPAVPAFFEWAAGNKKIIIYPKDAWQPETEYKIIFPESRSIMFTKIKQAEVSFSTIKYPKVVSFYPTQGAKEVILDIEDPIEVKFEKPIKDFSIKFSITPEIPLSYEFNEERDGVSVISSAGMKRGEKYEVKVYAAYAGNKNKITAVDFSSYAEIYASGFETLPPPPENWEKDFALRLLQAKKFTRAKITAGKYVDINLAAQVMSIFENGRVIDAFLISSGKRGMDTPKGEFKIYNKTPRAWSKAYGLYMPYWNAIMPSGKFGIHELPEWPGGYKEGANHLGIPVSHGCVRLGVGPAKIVYDFAEVGTPVVIY